MVNRKANPLVSVIIPSYNRARMLKEAIDSVLAQNFWDFELIVVDDGSTDATRDLLQVYEQKIVNLWQENKGVSSARNLGIASASGQFIALLDSDDLWLPNKLSQHVSFFHANPDALICQTEEIWIRNGCRVNPKKRHQKKSGFFFERSLERCLVSPSAVMLKRSLFDEVGGFDESLPACEDYDLWLRISCRYPIYLIETPLIIKRGGHTDQLSRAPGLDKFRIQSLEKILQSGLLSDAQYTAAVKTLRGKCAIYAAGCLKRGRKEEAQYYFSIAQRYS